MLCPLLAIAYAVKTYEKKDCPSECQREKCAWWIENEMFDGKGNFAKVVDNGCCSIKLLALKGEK